MNNNNVKDFSVNYNFHNSYIPTTNGYVINDANLFGIIMFFQILMRQYLHHPMNLISKQQKRISSLYKLISLVTYNLILLIKKITYRPLTLILYPIKFTIISFLMKYLLTQYRRLNI